MVFASALLANAASPSSEKRLIETAPGKRAWLTFSEIEGLAHAQHETGRCGGFFDVTDHPESRFLPLAEPFDLLGDREPGQQAVVGALLPRLSAQALHDRIADLSGFHNRFYKSETGVAAAHWIRDRFVQLSKGRTDVSVRLVVHEFPQPSVIATIQGSGPQANEHVILGGHEDSISWSGFGMPVTRRAPGADDNASGVATVLEVFRVLMDADYRPNRTIEFMAYAAEEVGLRGSQDIAVAYQANKTKVKAVMQLDMTMYPGKFQHIEFVSDNIDRGLTRFTQALVDTYVKVPWTEGACNYACSDHASWTRSGYPAVFPFETSTKDYNPNIHSDRDTLEKIDAAIGLHFAKLALAFVIEVSDGP